MNSILLKPTTYFLINLLALCFFGLADAKADDSSPQNITAPSAANVTIWGEATNGIAGGVFQGDWVFVYVRRQSESLPITATNLFYPFFGGTNALADSSFLHRLTGPYFWGATNSFCGPIELQDVDGHKISSLKPTVSSPEFYPDNFSFTRVYENWQLQISKFKYFLSVPPMPGDCGADFLCVSNKQYQIKSFRLTDYFKPEKAGEYKLTVWPKIYKQSETNKDLYKRIDVPPVTATIQWRN